MSAWRHYNNLVHRYLGYASAGPTLVYAVSGLVLNHGHQINPDFKVHKRHIPLPVAPPAAAPAAAQLSPPEPAAGMVDRLRRYLCRSPHLSGPDRGHGQERPGRDHGPGRSGTGGRGAPAAFFHLALLPLRRFGSGFPCGKPFPPGFLTG